MCNLWEVVYLLDELVVESDGEAADASQMGASWHQSPLAVECNLPPPPVFTFPSPAPPCISPSLAPFFGRGKTRTADVVLQ